ncbi:hypothetical protein G3I67_03655 [Orrella sp. NBD-18]|uniref:Uncharacterized protein n=1 Tax=Sheuella amnicola TaxID=2707330 RepID=A0A6B2QW80_9BURK|nr:hypothetical protein [Sheuella amnicola]NDY82322.1 hypothetical protein [Sheuella amnicola]
MKKTAMSPSDRLIKNFTSAYRELNIKLNESELKLEDYQKLLVSQFVNHVQPVEFDEAGYMYRDGYIISKLKQYLGVMKTEAESWKSFLRGYKVTLVRDVRGFYFEQIMFPRNIEIPIHDFILEKMSDSLSRTFDVNMTEEKLRTVFRLTPTTESQLELMKPSGIPVMAMSLGLELEPSNMNFEICFCWNESERIDLDGFYREPKREQLEENQTN